MRSLLVWFFLVQAFFSFGQNENKKWCFGANTGLDFMTSPPTVFATGMSSTEGSSAISDAAGNLLFYTKGDFVWNKLHTQMINSTGVIGGAGLQAVLIAKHPGNNSLYYILAPNGTGLRYSIVDMSLAAGLGDVTAKNVTLTTIAQTYKVAGTRHCNGKDLWILTGDLNTSTLRAYLLTSSGLNPTPVLSTSFTNNINAQLEFSPDGRKLASTDYAGTIQLYDFDTSTGMITKGIQIGNVISGALGVDFSPDGTKLYATRNLGAQVWQWDLCAGSASAITASQYTVNAGGTSKAALHLGPDGKIYVARPNQSALAVINNPNVAGAGCNYVETGQSIAPYFSSFALTNYIKSSYVPSLFTHTISPISCQNASFTAFPTQVASSGCAASNTLVTTTWDFGEPASGSANTSTLSNPVHTYGSPGTYTAMLILNYNCASDTMKQAVTISNVSPTLSVSGNAIVCEGQTTTLTASGASSYTWTGNGPAQLSQSLITNPATSGISVYTLTGMTSNGCSGIATVTVNALPKPVLLVSGKTNICQGSSETLTVTGASGYTWTNGSNSSTISAGSLNTAYKVSGMGLNGCGSTITVMTVSLPLPIFTLLSDTTCVGVPATLVGKTYAFSGTTFSWEPGGQTGNSITVQPSVTTIYTVTVNLNGCTLTGQTAAIITNTAQANTDFSYNTPVCKTHTLSQPLLHGSFHHGGSFLSSEGITLNESTGQINLVSSEPGTYQVTYTLAQAGCTSAGIHTAQVVIQPDLLLNYSSTVKVAPGASATLAVSGGDSYSWNPPQGLSCSDCADPVIIPAESATYCVSGAKGSCTTTACVYVEISCDTGFDFSVPNAFTPNGNGNNDEFCLQGWNACIKSFEVLIFNRWGEAVFRSGDPDFCWDGTHKGKQLDADAFVFRIRASYNDNKVVDKKGTINLIR